MLVSNYDIFVKSSDQSKGLSEKQRIEIAIYGLASEVGSVVAAVKKQLLGEDGIQPINLPNDEIIEELGDVIWYCFALSGLVNSAKPVNIFAHDIANLKREIGGSSPRAKHIGRILDTSRRVEFLAAAETFPQKAKHLEFEDYQSVAFLTARTEERTLIEVCLAVLWQLSAELLRRMLPDFEKEINQNIIDREINLILGEIAWHIAALASVYGVKLSDIAQKNMDKVTFRQDRSIPTPLHDANFPDGEQFPRKFEIAFVTVGTGRLRMYYNNKRLGDDLTDNTYGDDGYRYHDIMHLANVAKLSWSPVLRKLMGLKRKSNKLIDEVEDGARAQIVEEAVIKAIHGEGMRGASQRRPENSSMPERLFSNKAEITFKFLKLIRNFVTNLEVHVNKYWEWEESIVSGHKIFWQLRCETQGTVAIDMDRRSIEFRPDVCIDAPAKVEGLGTAYLPHSSEGSRWNKSELTSREIATTTGSIGEFERLIVQKRAILEAMDMRGLETSLEVTNLDKGRISVKTAGDLQAAVWRRSVIGFRTAFSETEGGIHCTALAITDA